MNNGPEMLGEYVRLTKTQEIVELQSYDSRTAKVKSRAGIVSVGRHEIERITANEEAEFLRSTKICPT
jgi:hypothetical protein